MVELVLGAVMAGWLRSWVATAASALGVAALLGGLNAGRPQATIASVNPVNIAGGAGGGPRVSSTGELEVALQVDCPYCTAFGALVGMEYNPADPDFVTVVMASASGMGLVGENCTKVDKVHGRRPIARIPLNTTKPSMVTVKFRAKVLGGACETLSPAERGYRQFALTLDVQPGVASTTYITGATLSQAGAVGASTRILVGAEAIPYILQERDGVRALASLENPGLFGICPTSGAVITNYTIYASANAVIAPKT